MIKMQRTEATAVGSTASVRPQTNTLRSSVETMGGGAPPCPMVQDTTVPPCAAPDPYAQRFIAAIARIALHAVQDGRPPAVAAQKNTPTPANVKVSPPEAFQLSAWKALRPDLPLPQSYAEASDGLRELFNDGEVA